MVTKLITLGTNNTAANGNSSLPDLGGTVFDSSGNLSVFTTKASNLIDDTNGQEDVYLYNLTTKSFTNLTLKKSDGTLTGAASKNPSISADGTRVVLESNEINLSNVPALGGSDIYLVENLGNTPPKFTLLSKDYNNVSHLPSISADGKWVVFETLATTPTDKGVADGADRDIILLDLINNNSMWVSQVTNHAGNPATAADSTNASVSGNGKYVVFQSNVPESELMPQVGGANGVSDIFLFNKDDKSLTLVSRLPQINPLNAGNSSSINPAISADGKYIVYESNASDLVSGDTNGVSDIFLYEVDTGKNERISLRPGDLNTQKGSFSPTISSDGAFVAFVSSDEALVANDTNGMADIFVWERATGNITRVNVGNNGEQANLPSSNPVISPDGKSVSFESTSNTLGSPTQAGITNLFVVNADNTPPTVTINLADNALTTGETTTVSFTFSEAPVGFEIPDITAENGTLTNLAVDPTNPLIYTATFTPTANVNDTTNVITVADKSYSDATGNQGAAATSGTYSINTVNVPTPDISINDVTIEEGDNGTKDLTFTVTLSVASTQVVTVNYATADQTATAGSDYTATNGVLTFNAGETSKQIKVPIIGDTVDEANETFQVNLSNASNATIADNRGIGTITNDDLINPGSVLDTAMYRFQNTDVPGTYLFAGEEEAKSIRKNYKNFDEEGLAFMVANDNATNDPLLEPMYRFQNEDVPGTYLFAGEQEAIAIRNNYPNFKEEGLAFYVYSPGSGMGDTFSRFQNKDRPGTYLFAGPEETQDILSDYPNFKLEGEAFEAGG